MNKKSDKDNRKKKSRTNRSLVSEQAAAYGVTLPAAPTSAERFLSPNDIGKIMNVTGEAVKQWIYHRRLPAVKLANGYWKVRVSDFESFLKARHEVGRRRVLITDTGNGNLDQVTRAVETVGHQPVIAHNYADAMLKALDHHPALLIIHLKARETDPWKLAEKVRETKKLRGVPILFVADAEPTEAEAERALTLSAQGFLKAPISDQMLVQEIAHVLDRSV